MNREKQLLALKNMMRIRRMEEVCAELYTQEKIRGFLHLYIGEEAVATGVLIHIEAKDNVIATYREHAHALLKGISANAIMAEMFGKSGGCALGRGGSMHLYSVKNRFYGGNAIVGSGIPHALGLALAAKQLDEDRLTVCFFGEGAMCEGIFWESLNLAALWKIPLLFCCENNLYAMGTSLARSQAEPDLTKKVLCHAVAATQADGMDVDDVMRRTSEGLDYIRNEKKPFFLEMKTYRFRAHSMFDPQLYRSKEEIENWKRYCPIERYQSRLLEDGILDEVTYKYIQAEVEQEIDAAIAFAESSPLEPISDIEQKVYAQRELDN